MKEEKEPVLHRQYMSVFWEKVQGLPQEIGNRHQQAWEETERFHQEKLGGRRYQNYHSFRTGKHKKPSRARIRKM